MLNSIKLLSFLLSLILPALAIAQSNNNQAPNNVPISPEIYNSLKAQGLLNPDANYVFTTPAYSGTVPMPRSNRSTQLAAPPCGYISTVGFQDPWGGDVYFDDAPPAGEFSVEIPFEFCFYGTNYTSFFINNNGNITFEQSFNTFTAETFPANGIPPMIAPFWGDVDTGSDINPLGQVRYDVFPEYAVVSWDSVAVFPENGALRNTFQVLISNGTSSVLPPGNNIAFIYGDMQWTTGTASGGAGGFGGTPATVGVNRGDGVDYIQLGQFDAPGTAYDGPFGTNDQVSFLDNTVFFFNTCLQPGAQNNIAPLAIGAPLCDTIVVCAGSDYGFDFSFIPVEPNQTVDAILVTDAVPGFTLGGITPGTQCNVVGTFTGSLSNLGYHTVTFTATDNGTPAASYTINIVFNVIESGFVPDIIGVPFICDGASTTLSVGGGEYDEYVWGPNNEATPTITVSEPGTYSVTVLVGGCVGESLPYTVGITSSPQPVIAGGDTVCNTATTQLYTTQPYSAYFWSSIANTDTVDVSGGTYTVTVTDTNGCQGTSPAFVVTSVTAIVPVIVGDNHTCFDEFAVVTTATPYVSYDWSNGENGDTASAQAGIITVTVTDDNGCVGTSQPFQISNSRPNPALYDIEPFCKYDSIWISTADTFDTFVWVYNGDTLSTLDSVLWWGGETNDNMLEIFVTDEFGCAGADSASIAFTELPNASFTANPEVTAILKNTLINFTDTSTPGAGDTLAGWQWVFNPPDPLDTLLSQNQSITYPDTGMKDITLIVTTVLGCRDTITYTIESIDKPFVPNVFSPNGDGKNDKFEVPFLYGYPDNTVVVFNRWGKKVYEATNYKSDWGGDDLPSGTYFYVVAAPTLSEPLKGTVTIIKE